MGDNAKITIEGDNENLKEVAGDTVKIMQGLATQTKNAGTAAGGQGAAGAAAMAKGLKNLDEITHSVGGGLENIGEHLQNVFVKRLYHQAIHKVFEAIKDVGEGYSEARERGEGFWNSLMEGVEHAVGIKTLTESIKETDKAMQELESRRQHNKDTAQGFLRSLNPENPQGTTEIGGQNVSVGYQFQHLEQRAEVEKIIKENNAQQLELAKKREEVEKEISKHKDDQANRNRLIPWVTAGAVDEQEKMNNLVKQDLEIRKQQLDLRKESAKVKEEAEKAEKEQLEDKYNPIPAILRRARELGDVKDKISKEAFDRGQRDVESAYAAAMNTQGGIDSAESMYDRITAAAATDVGGTGAVVDAIKEGTERTVAAIEEANKNKNGPQPAQGVLP